MTSLVETYITTDILNLESFVLELVATWTTDQIQTSGRDAALKTSTVIFLVLVGEDPFAWGGPRCGGGPGRGG